MSDGEQWVSTEAAVALLGRTRRQLDRYADNGKIRKQSRGRHVYYNRGDIETIVATFRPNERPRVEINELMPPGEMLNAMTHLHEQLTASAARIGYLQAQLEQRPQLEDQRKIEQELIEERSQRKALEQQVTQMRGSQRTISTTALIIGFILVLVIGVLIAYIILR